MENGESGGRRRREADRWNLVPLPESGLGTHLERSVRNLAERVAAGR